MDPEHSQRDARAVVDPIAAIFDLAESVDRQTPKIRKMLRYARIFVSLWLLLDFVLILVLSGPGVAYTLLLFVPIIGFLLLARYVRGPSTRLAMLIVASIFAALQILTFGPALLIGTPLVFLFVLGFIILELMRDLRSFFDYFGLRHRVIQRVREADPIVYVPEGKDSVQRILTYLSAMSPDLRAAMALPGGLAAPALMTGRSGLAYSFDAHVRSAPSSLARAIGIGPAGFTVYVKAFDHPPTVADLQALKRGVEDVSAASKIPPARVIALWSARGEESVAADAYEFLTHEVIRTKVRGSAYICSLELAREGDDGTYDFIPVVMEPALARSATLSSVGA